MGRGATRVTIAALALVSANLYGVGDWSMASALAAVGSQQVRIVGLLLTVEPASIVGAPRNVPLLLTTRLKDSSGDEIRDDDYLRGLRVRGTLKGPGLTESVEVATIPGEPIEIGTGSDTPNVRQYQ